MSACQCPVRPLSYCISRQLVALPITIPMDRARTGRHDEAVQYCLHVFPLVAKPPSISTEVVLHPPLHPHEERNVTYCTDDWWDVPATDRRPATPIIFYGIGNPRNKLCIIIIYCPTMTTTMTQVTINFE